jgi:hypothetical protein
MWVHVAQYRVQLVLGSVATVLGLINDKHDCLSAATRYYVCVFIHVASLLLQAVPQASGGTEPCSSKRGKCYSGKLESLINCQCNNTIYTARTRTFKIN